MNNKQLIKKLIEVSKSEYHVTGIFLGYEITAHDANTFLIQEIVDFNPMDFCYTVQINNNSIIIKYDNFNNSKRFFDTFEKWQLANNLYSILTLKDEVKTARKTKI